MSRSYTDVQDAYRKIKNSKSNFGTYHKSIFHVHTPDSYDYTLFEDWSRNEYKIKNYSDIFKICIDWNVIPSTFEIDKFQLEEEYSIYESKVEFLSFILLAHTLLKNKIEIVSICDHNSIDGIDKLILAIKKLYDTKRYKVYTSVISGIEVSCADRIHVVGLFENSKSMRGEIDTWLNENLMTIEEGTFLTSYDVMEFFNEMGAVTYMAHLNTSNIFKEKKFLSGGYRSKLLSSKFGQLIGVSNLTSIDTINAFVKNYRKTTPNYLLDNDSHNIDSVHKNVFWIKGNKINFQMIKEALLDFDISVSYEKEFSSKSYIKGILIKYEKDGFLSGCKDKKDFIINFSDSLNCFIGGRGTGKSTILQIIDFILSQKCKSIELLEFICQHGNAWILYFYNEKEYIVELLTPYKQNNDHNILKSFGQNSREKYHYRYRFNPLEVEEFARVKFINVFEAVNKKTKTWFEPVMDKRKILNEFYDTRYSVNELVRTASSSEINQFIFDIMFRNELIANPSNCINVRSISGLKRILVEIDEIFKKRKIKVLKVLNPFNTTQDGILKIEYSQDEVPIEPQIKKWIFDDSSDVEKFYYNFNITKENLLYYLLNIYDEIGIIELLRLAIEPYRREKRNDYSIIPYSLEYTDDLIEKELIEITNDNEKKVIDLIFDKLVTETNKYEIINYLKSYVAEMERFSLKFNVNSKESNHSQKVLYKDVRDISLGQKVVAMLDFILGYCEYSEDYRPLIIDQPEDNLDSQYIYKNLVHQLRSVKTKRQIIVATHNATIVTNAMADNVCVMESDGKHGWISQTGYPGEKRIKKSIINYLEGGIDSYIHKIQIYKEVIEE